MSAPTPAVIDATTGSHDSERRPYAFLLANAALIGAVTFVASWMLDRPVADPEGSFLGPSWVRLPVLCLTAIVIDLLPRALWQGRLDPARTVAAVRHRVRTHWTRARLQLVVVGISGFYVVYVAYRNLKSLLPLVRDVKYDSELRVLTAFDSSTPNSLAHRPWAVPIRTAAARRARRPIWLAGTTP